MESLGFPQRKRRSSGNSNAVFRLGYGVFMVKVFAWLVLPVKILKQSAELVPKTYKRLRGEQVRPKLPVGRWLLSSRDGASGYTRRIILVGRQSRSVPTLSKPGRHFDGQSEATLAVWKHEHGNG